MSFSKAHFSLRCRTSILNSSIACSCFRFGGFAYLDREVLVVAADVCPMGPCLLYSPMLACLGSCCSLVPAGVRRLPGSFYAVGVQAMRLLMYICGQLQSLPSVVVLYMVGHGSAASRLVPAGTGFACWALVASCWHHCRRGSLRLWRYHGFSVLAVDGLDVGDPGACSCHGAGRIWSGECVDQPGFGHCQGYIL